MIDAVFDFFDAFWGWTLGLHPDKLYILVMPFLLVDTPRYALSKVIVMFIDVVRGDPKPPAYDYCPSVAVLLSGHNEAETIGATIESIAGTYPRLDIVVIDDGSTDGMSDRVLPYVRSGFCRLLRKPLRGGKSSSINYGISQSDSEVVVIVDTDGAFEPNAIWELVQPFKNPVVGGVGGNLRVRNRRKNLCTMSQAYEYLHTIFMGRMVTSRMNFMSVCSGAISAFRREAVERSGGWDVGPGEDGDITLKIRKIGYRVTFAPYATTQTDVPDTWITLMKQRRRWERGLIRYKCRKHSDMIDPFSANFNKSNALLILNAWIFKIGLLFAFWVYVGWILFNWDEYTPYILMLTYLVYQFFQIMQVIVLMYYSDRPLEDLGICLAIPFIPIYKFAIRLVYVVAMIEEIFMRRSYEDPYVPRRVRESTIHW